MKFYAKNWYYIGGVLFVVLTFLMGFFGNYFSRIEVILIYSFMSLLIHQFEEYALPGGFPTFFNVIMNGETKTPDRYPQNSLLAMIVNVPLAYWIYILPILFPNVIWLGLGSMFFGFSQILFHGIMMNRYLRSFYNPGLAACIFLHGPIGAYYIWYVSSNGLDSAGDYFGGIIMMIVGTLLVVVIPIKLFATRDSKYPFSKEEMERFGMLEKAKQLEGKNKPMPMFQK